MSHLETMRERRAALKIELDDLLAVPTAEKRDLNATEDVTFSDLIGRIERADEQIAQLEKAEVRSDAAAATRVIVGDAGEQRGTAKVTDPPVYAEGKVETSYFRDLHKARKGDSEAADRLRRNDAQRSDALEKRALGNTGATGGSGGLVLLAAAAA